MKKGDDGDGGLDAILLAGRLGLDDDGWPILPLIDLLEGRGISARVLCIGRRSGQTDPRVVEAPGLGRRWSKYFALRKLERDAPFGRPRLLHAVHEEAAGSALALAEAWSVPYIQTIDDFVVMDDGLRVSRGRLFAVVASSDELAGALTGELKVPASLVTVIPPGLPVEPASRRDPSASVPVVGAAGPPDEETGFGPFLDAARILLDGGRDVEFLIAAQGGDAIGVRRRALALRVQDHVTVADFPSVGPLFRSVLDLYCQPSLAASSGRTLALAMAQGIPSVATDVQGLRSLVRPGLTGLLARPNDPEGLAAALAQMLDHPEFALGLGAAGRELVRARHSLDAEADRLADLYRRCIAESPRKA